MWHEKLSLLLRNLASHTKYELLYVFNSVACFHWPSFDHPFDFGGFCRQSWSPEMGVRVHETRPFIVGAIVTTVLSCSLLLILRRKVGFTIPFVPHMVSCVVSEYYRGTNKLVLDSTIRQRMSRLATLPIPDFDYITLLDGSECVARAIIYDRPNFTTVPRLLVE